MFACVCVCVGPLLLCCVSTVITSLIEEVSICLELNRAEDTVLTIIYRVGKILIWEIESRYFELLVCC